MPRAPAVQPKAWPLPPVPVANWQVMDDNGDCQSTVSTVHQGVYRPQLPGSPTKQPTVGSSLPQESGTGESGSRRRYTLSEYLEGNPGVKKCAHSFAICRIVGPNMERRSRSPRRAAQPRVHKCSNPPKPPLKPLTTTTPNAVLIFGCVCGEVSHIGQGFERWRFGR
jgi:hypothetical protein